MLSWTPRSKNGSGTRCATRVIGAALPTDGLRWEDLPLARYTDPEFFALEREHLWKKVWTIAGHTSELPAAGSYKTIDVVGAPIVVVRGEDGEVRAFFNSCRHRGAPVVREPCGTERRLRCQFHSWSYDLKGQLVAVPDQRDFVRFGSDRAGPGAAAV